MSTMTGKTHSHHVFCPSAATFSAALQRLLKKDGSTEIADQAKLYLSGLPVLNRPEMHHSSQNRKLQQHQLPSEHRLRNVLLWWECSLLHMKRDQSKCQELNNLVLKGNLKIVSRTQP